ncbi:enoyl-CoA hydratase/isomerase family protein [Arthrobacter sp. ISL-28]|uniref:enoyl-CoA hydratase/isomerase family protein n=1 Tax=Arthrobacter sp. ISL-28 TaxID=2819108 RepID=UPI001BE6857E|nr:enoyl-CoA hydratase-related protein [Arthrobacter sp. ISL-28]MBT2523325.1 enoyl-CoA hydratase/isomerase family protein [Arthrobacter sp. ISL-28]
MSEGPKTAVGVELIGAVAVITIDNPPANAMSTAVIGELEEAVTALESDRSVRAVVFTALGGAAFLSGADITELPARMADPEKFHSHTERVRALFARVAGLPQPTISAVQADAVGGGLEFVLLTDLVVAAPKVKFALPEVRLGLIPGAGGTQRLSRRIPPQVAAEMIFLGRPISAQRALELGLINRVCAAESLRDEAMALANSLAELPRVAVQAAKRALRGGESAGSLTEGLAAEGRAFTEAAASADAQEGCLAFLERRRPSFSHE